MTTVLELSDALIMLTLNVAAAVALSFLCEAVLALRPVPVHACARARGMHRLQLLVQSTASTSCSGRCAGGSRVLVALAARDRDRSLVALAEIPSARVHGQI